MSQLTPVQIKVQLRQFSQPDLLRPALDLFGLLGLASERRLDLNGLQIFKSHILEQAPRFDAVWACLLEWRNVHLLFQLTEEEIAATQLFSDFDDTEDVGSLYQSYIFMAIDLIKSDYSPTKLTAISKQINRIFPDPVFILFRYQQKIGFSLVMRRSSLKDEDEIVLEDADLLYDIHFLSPSIQQLRAISGLAFKNIGRDSEIKAIEQIDLSWRKVFTGFDHSELKPIRSRKQRYDHTRFHSEEVANVITRPYWSIRDTFNLSYELVDDNVDEYIPRLIDDYFR